jgi:hypothetical protein
MRRLILSSGTLVGLIAIALFAPALRADAVTTPSPTNNGVGQALEIAPPVINLTADPGQVIKTEISIRDVSSGKLRVSSEINDFLASGEDGVPKILLNDEEESPYSLKNWISPLPSLLLNPKELKKLPVTIKVPTNAAPGGYYGVVRFTATAPELDDTGVSLSASLGALILVRVNGAAKEELSIESFTVNTVPGGIFDAKANGTPKNLFESLPIQFVERIRNSGNVHEQPAGQVVIKNMFGKKVAAQNVNLPPRNILPGSIRKFSQPLDKSVIGNNRFFGRYTAELKITYGPDKKTITKTTTFWVIPVGLIIGAVVALIALFIAFRVMIKRYNRAVIRKAQKRARRRK